MVDKVVTMKKCLLLGIKLDSALILTLLGHIHHSTSDKQAVGGWEESIYVDGPNVHGVSSNLDRQPLFSYVIQDIRFACGLQYKWW